MYMIVDTIPTGIGWVINQEGEDGACHVIRFGAEVISERQRGYAQVKREHLEYRFCTEGRQRLLGLNPIIGKQLMGRQGHIIMTSKTLYFPLPLDTQ